MNIPHGESRFVGYADEKLNADVLRKHIFGSHVAEWMKSLKTEDPEAFKRHFSQYIKHNINPEDVEKKWTAVHAAIRKDPEFKKSTKQAPKEHTKKLKRPASLADRKNRVRQLIAARAKADEKA